MDQRGGEGDPPLLTTAHVLHQAIIRWQLQQLRQVLLPILLNTICGMERSQPFHMSLLLDESVSDLLTDLVVFKPIHRAEVTESVAHGKLADQGDFLRHVAHSRSRNPGTLAAWGSSQHPELTIAQLSNTNDAGQERGLTATAGSQEAVSVWGSNIIYP